MNAAFSDASQRLGGPVVLGPALSPSNDGLREEFPAGSSREPAIAEITDNVIVSSPVLFRNSEPVLADDVEGEISLPITKDVDDADKTDGNLSSLADQWSTPKLHVEKVGEEVTSPGSEGGEQVLITEEEDIPLGERILKRRASASPKDTETDRPTGETDDGGSVSHPRRETGVA